MRSRNYVAYTIVLSAVKFPRKSHPILWAGLINLVYQKGKDGLDLNVLSSRLNQKNSRHPPLKIKTTVLCQDITCLLTYKI